MVKFIGLMALALAGVANAGTDNFTPNTACSGTSCAAYNNDNPDMTVTFVNPYYSTGVIIVTLNGVTYRGLGNYSSTLLSNPDPYHFTYLLHTEAAVLSDPIGNHVLLTMDVFKSRNLNRSGHNVWVTQYAVLSGTVTQ